jgi:uncharacterized protein (DUF2342 family)
MDRAGAGAVPEAERFSRVLRRRRQERGGLARVLQQVVGIEAKLRQYEEGERFIAEAEAALGPRAMDRVWWGPREVPDLDEVRRPGLWIERQTAAAG